jgi:hypothetical protein
MRMRIGYVTLWIADLQESTMSAAEVFDGRGLPRPAVPQEAIT